MLIFFIALFLRLVAVFMIGDRSLENEFDTITRHLLAGNGFAYFSVLPSGEVVSSFQLEASQVFPSAYMPPLYPGVLALFCGLFGMEQGVGVMLFLQAILGALTVVFLYRIACMKTTRAIARISTMLAMGYPLLVYTASQVSAVSLYVFLSVGMVYFLFHFEATGKRKSLIGASIFGGLLVLARTQTVVLLPFILGWMWAMKRKMRYKEMLLFIIIVGAIVFPWGLRNKIVLGSWTLNTTGGLNLWLGQHPLARGTHPAYTPEGALFEKEILRIYQQTPKNAQFELSLDTSFKEEATHFIVTNPSQTAVLAIQKFSFFWGHFWDTNIHYPGANSPLYWLMWYSLLPFLLIGIVHSLQSKKAYFLFYVYFMVSSILAMTFFVLPRYRLFILPWVFILVAEGIMLTYQKVFKRS